MINEGGVPFLKRDGRADCADPSQRWQCHKKQWMVEVVLSNINNIRRSESVFIVSHGTYQYLITYVCIGLIIRVGVDAPGSGV